MISNQKYDVVVGIEVHTELDVKTKIFCSCKKTYGEPVNTHVCPVCAGHPNQKPELNKKCLELAIRAGLCVDSKINEISHFDRKNYFYQDLPKGYQVSQVDEPICLGGGITLDSGKFVRIHQIHLEEDTGKVMGSLMDLNRCGVALIELVTEPDFCSGEEVVDFITKLRLAFIYAGVSACIMEQGEMRCDINISVKKKGDKELGVRTEVKNVSSFKAIVKVVDYEAERHIKLVEAGKKVVTQTLRWDESENKTVAMRGKAGSTHYRVFEDPDFPRIKVSAEVIEKIKESLPILPKAWRERFLSLGLSLAEANILIEERSHLPYFEECLKLGGNARQICSWLLNDGFKLKKEAGKVLFDVAPASFVQIIKMVDDKKITRDNGVKLLREVYKTGSSPAELAKNMGLFDTVADNIIEDIIKELLKQNPQLKSDYTARPDRVEPFVVGQVMKRTQGKAKSEDVKEIMKKYM